MNPTPTPPLPDRLPQTLLDIAAEVEADEMSGVRLIHSVGAVSRPSPCPRKHLLRTPCLPRPLALKSRPGRGARGEGG